MKNMFRYSCLFLFAAGIFSACRKEEPIPADQTPVFTASGTIGSSSLNLKAGVNNYYMYTSYSAAFAPAIRFEGDLRLQNSTTHSPSSLRVLIYGIDSNYTSGDSSLDPGFFSYSTATSSSYDVTFNGDVSGNQNATFSWNFGDNLFGTGYTVTHTYTSPGQFAVTMHASDSCSVNDTITSNLYLANGTNLSADFTMTSFPGDSVLFTATPSGGSGTYTYYWDNFTDTPGFTTTQGSFIKPYPSGPGLYQATLKVIDSSTNDSAYITKNVNVNSPACTPNFSYFVSPTPAQDVHKVIIEWTDANGVTWTSQNPLQPGTSTFQVTESVEYGPNENGIPTRKLHILATCTLYNGNNTMQLQNADIVFGFGHP